MRAYGILKKDVFVEANALELKGEYVGQTAPRVQGIVRSAMGGVLFLDEAYALAGGGSGKSDCFSNEAIRTLLTEVENNRTSVLVILAGYRDKMSTMLRADPGLPRRFPHALHLSDYSPSELARISEDRAFSTFGLRFEAGLGARLAEAFGTIYASEISSHNGGLAVRVVEEAASFFTVEHLEYTFFATIIAYMVALSLSDAAGESFTKFKQATGGFCTLYDSFDMLLFVAIAVFGGMSGALFNHIVEEVRPEARFWTVS